MRLIVFSKIMKDLPMIEAIRASAEIGYEGIELHDCHLPPDLLNAVKADELSKASNDLGIELVNLATFVGGFSELSSADCDREFTKFMKYLNIARRLGIPYIRLNPGRPEPEKATVEQWQRSSSWINKAADLAHAHGISIVLEMHEGSLIATVESTLKFLNMVDRDNVVVNYDVGNIFHVPADYGVGALRAIEDRVKFIHVRDERGRGSDGQWVYTLLGDGVLDYRPIFKRLKEIDFQGYLSAECHAEPTPGMSSIMIAAHEYPAIKSLWEKS